MTKRKPPADPPRVEWVDGQLSLPGTYEVTEPTIVAGKSVQPGDTVTFGQPTTVDPVTERALRRRRVRAALAGSVDEHVYGLAVIDLETLRGFCSCGHWRLDAAPDGQLSVATEELHRQWSEHRLDALVRAAYTR